MNAAHHSPADTMQSRAIVALCSSCGPLPSCTAARLRASSSPPPMYPIAQPVLETRSRSSGPAICGRNELYTTFVAPYPMFATRNSPAPSRYREPVRKIIARQAPAETYVNRASRRFLCAERSATAPTTGSTNTVRNTDSETVYGNSEPAATVTPSTSTLPFASAALSATDPRYGPRNTVTTVVENAELAKS